MIGTKFYKDNYDSAEYADCAIWCNENNAMINDMGEYYEVVEIPGPTLEELRAQKLEKAGITFAEKRDAIRWIAVSDNNTYGFDCKNEDITNFFAAWKAAEKVGNTSYKVWISETEKSVIILQLADFDTVFDTVRTSQLEAYAWYEEIRTKINKAKSENELKTITIK